MQKFIFSNEVNLSQIKREIESSMITVAIDVMSIEDGSFHIKFKSDLSEVEQVMLTSIVDGHIPADVKSEPEQVQLSMVTATDGIPYVYSTSKPLNHYVCFQGADDITDPDELKKLPPHMSNPVVPGIGMGNKLTFRLTSNNDKVVKDFTFNENVYVKDGYIIAKDAPFGATLDIDIIHPQYGVLFPFGRAIPVYGTGWFTLDTEDRGYLPKGLIVRIAVNNSAGNDTNLTEDSPSTFGVFGRFELYRPKPPGS